MPAILNFFIAFVLALLYVLASAEPSSGSLAILMMIDCWYFSNMDFISLPVHHATAWFKLFETSAVPVKSCNSNIGIIPLLIQELIKGSICAVVVIPLVLLSYC